MKMAAAGLLGFLLIATNVFAAEDSAEKTLTRSYPVEPDGILTVDVDQGDIQVIAGDENKVNIVVDRQAIGATSENSEESALKKQKINFTQEGNHVHVQARNPKSRSFSLHSRPDVVAHFRITVPRRFGVVLNTGNGNVEVSGLTGTADARTSGGDLSYTNIDGAVTAHTSGGNIRVMGCTDKLEAHSSGGSILVNSCTGTSAMLDTLGGNVEVKTCTGSVQAKTSGGNMIFEDYSGPSIYAETLGGTIYFELKQPPTSACWFHTSGGDIHARIFGEIGLNLNANTDGGSITTDIPVSNNTPGKLTETHVEGTLNGGGPTLTLRTSGGDIDIIKR